MTTSSLPRSTIIDTDENEHYYTRPSRVYLAGPMRGYANFNFPAFDKEADRLRAGGFEVFSPAERDRADGLHPGTKPDWAEGKNPPHPLSHYMAIDLPEVCKCDFVVALPGWSKSEGCRIEFLVAAKLGKPILEAGTLQPIDLNKPLHIAPMTEDEEKAFREDLQRQMNETTPMMTCDNWQKVRKFETGATRDTENGKPDYEGFLSPDVLELYGAYMHKHRKQLDGQLRDSDNWQKGIPVAAYMKSMWRHFFAVWRLHRGLRTVDEKGAVVTMEDALMATLFNVMGYTFEWLKKKQEKERELADFCFGAEQQRED